MIERVQTFPDLLARTPLDELCTNIRVKFSGQRNDVIEAIVCYLVAPRDAGNVKSRLIKNSSLRLTPLLTK